MRELQADGQWPVWTAPRNPAYADEDGYGGIACYVTPAALEDFPAVFRPGLRDVLRQRTGESGAALDRLVTRELWEALVGWEIPYDAPPWNPEEGQRIRDPWWLLRRHGAGTCLDFGLLFAAACLRHELDVSLIMLRGAKRAHVAVAVRPGAKAGAEWVLRGVSDTGAAGVTVIDDPARFAADKRIMLLDVTVASAGRGLEREIGDAQAAAISALTSPEYPYAHLVDVAVRQRSGDREFPAPRRRGALRGRVMPSDQETRRFPAHKEAWDALRERSGKVVIHGPQGVGKSTLAREVARLADNGFGWFLTSTSRVAFETALAEHELGERGKPVRALEAVDRKGLAQAALTRLRRSEDPWVIVLDNANAGAATFDEVAVAADRLPQPRDGQLIIATSTAAPGTWPGWDDPVSLPPVPEAEIASEAGDKQIARLSAGRPLLMAAFARLLAAAPDAREEFSSLLADATGGADPEQDNDLRARQAAGLYWALARKRLAPGPLACAERFAWMPPDRLDPGVCGDDRQARDALTRIGLLGGAAEAGTHSMHRLFGEAIRDAVTADGRAERTVRELLALPQARSALLRHADPEVVMALADALAGTTSGLALWALGALQEVHQSKLSQATFTRAQTLLNVADPEQAAAYADCLHARARVVNQDRKASLEAIHAAIADMRRAIDLRADSDDIGIAKHQALLALLRQRAARALKNPERTLELREVKDILEQSWQRRLAGLGPEDPLVDRAYFNRAGVRISLAKADPANAAGYLAEAEKVYRETLRFRRRYYNGANPITASSVAGIGIWGYHAVWLDVASEPAAVLAEAIAAAVESLDMRRTTSNDGDVGKSANLLAKLGALQSDRVNGKPQESLAEVAGELGFVAELAAELDRLGEE